MRVPQAITEVMLDAAGAAGRRAIVSRGWAELSLDGKGTDWLAIDEVDHAALFRRVAAVVHGAPAARCGILEDEPEERVAAGRHRLRHQDDLVVGPTRCGLTAGHTGNQCRASRHGDPDASAPGQHGNVRSVTPNVPMSRRSLPTSRSNVR